MSGARCVLAAHAHSLGNGPSPLPTGSAHGRRAHASVTSRRTPQAICASGNTIFRVISIIDESSPNRAAIHRIGEPGPLRAMSPTPGTSPLLPSPRERDEDDVAAIPRSQLPCPSGCPHPAWESTGSAVSHPLGPAPLHAETAATPLRRHSEVRWRGRASRARDGVRSGLARQHPATGRGGRVRAPSSGGSHTGTPALARRAGRRAGCPSRAAMRTAAVFRVGPGS